MKISTRFLKLDDLPGAVACQAVYDEDLDQMTLPDYGWDEKSIRDSARTRKNKKTGTKETHALVAEVPVDDDENGAQLICGVVVYEYDDEAYTIKLLAALDVANAAVRSTLLKLVVDKARRNKRHSVQFECSDYDHDNLRTLVRAGWRRKLIPYGFDGHADAWRFDLEFAGPATNPKDRGRSCNLHEDTQ